MAVRKGGIAAPTLNFSNNFLFVGRFLPRMQTLELKIHHFGIILGAKLNFRAAIISPVEKL